MNVFSLTLFLSYGCIDCDLNIPNQSNQVSSYSVDELIKNEKVYAVAVKLSYFYTIK